MPTGKVVRLLGLRTEWFELNLQTSLSIGQTNKLRIPLLQVCFFALKTLFEMNFLNNNDL